MRAQKCIVGARTHLMEFKMRKFNALIAFCIALTTILLFASGCMEADAEAEPNRAETSLSAEPVNVLADGAVIGLLLGYKDTLEVEFNPDFKPARLWSDGKIQEASSHLLFSGPDCSGDVYAETDFYENTDDAPFKLQRKKGEIFTCHAPECAFPLYYLKPNENKYYIASVFSYYSHGSCSNFTQASLGSYYKLLPNDPAVTGIQEYPFPIPLAFDGMETLELERVEVP